MNNLVSIKNVSKSYGKKQVFKDFSLDLPAGRIIGMLGENGIGKTTLLKMITHIVKPDQGQIKIMGQEVSRHTKDLVSFLIEPVQLEHMKVSDSIKFHQNFYSDFCRTKAEELCNAFSIETKGRIASLSKGEQERICLVLCLSRRVPLYLLDEPIAAF